MNPWLLRQLRVGKHSGALPCTTRPSAPVQVHSRSSCPPSTPSVSSRRKPSQPLHPPSTGTPESSSENGAAGRARQHHHELAEHGPTTRELPTRSSRRAQRAWQPPLFPPALLGADADFGARAGPDARVGGGRFPSSTTGHRLSSSA